MNDQKLEKLKEHLKELGSVAVAFSGGVDSTFLLYVAKQVLGDNVLAITVDATATHRKDLSEAKEFLEKENIKHEIIKIDQLAIEGFKENPENICYLCKRTMFTKIKEVAKEHGIDNIIEGSNKDDLKLFRPGMKALEELEIKSPMMEIGIRKDTIRSLAQQFELKAFDKPSNSCLATRVKTGEIITEEKLKKIEEAEKYLIDNGWDVVRVRMLGNDASIEVEENRVEDLVKHKDSVERKLKEIGFNQVEINPLGYTAKKNRREELKDIKDKTLKEVNKVFKKKTLYLDCSAGISGDMMVASLLDLGADKEKLLEALKTIPIDGFKIIISRVIKDGKDCQDFDVVLDHPNHDHDMEYLHGENYEEKHEHHHHDHRHLKDIVEIIDQTEMSNNARVIAKEIFLVLAEGESKAHNEPIEKVHFHEVGAVDSIVDVVAVAFCLDDLKIGKVIVPKLCEGTGTVRCAHGVLPVPVPAVKHIVEDNDIELDIMDVEGEFVTPTGAAIVAAVRTSDELPSDMKIIKTGLGAGKREYKRASILKAMILESN